MWRVAVFVVGVSIASLLLWYQGILAGLAALAIILLEKLPEWQTWINRRFEARRIRDVSLSIASSCRTCILSDVPFVRAGQSSEAIAGCGQEYGFLDSGLPERIAEEAIRDSGLADLAKIPQRTLISVVLMRILDKVSPDGEILVREAVSRFLSSQMSFKSDEVRYANDGMLFLQLINALAKEPINDIRHLEKIIHESLEKETCDELAFSILDPRLFYLVTRLGKASSLEDIIARQASGRRVASFLARRDPMVRTQAGRRQYFLVLKQEYRHGRMNIKKRIDLFPDRITGTGWIYSGSRMKSRYQSISVVPSPVRYSNADEFLAKHFPGMQSLTESERKRASIVAIPIEVDRASFLPDPPELVLDASHLEFLGNWLRFFHLKPSRRTTRPHQEFEVTMTEILNALSIDFLVKNPTRGETEYFRKNTDRILRSLGLRSLFELHTTETVALHRKAKELGFPSYWPEDIEKNIRDDSMPLAKWLDHRLYSVLNEASKTARRISGLQAHHM